MESGADSRADRSDDGAIWISRTALRRVEEEGFIHAHAYIQQIYRYVYILDIVDTR